MKKCVITAIGKDKVGLIAKITAYFEKTQINVLDINQTIVDGYGNMMMIVDVTEAKKDITVIAKELKQLGEENGIMIHCQRTEIFEKMHRL